MRWSEIEPRLAPRSGVGVIAPWLIISPPRNALIRLDLRLMDRVEARTEGALDEEGIPTVNPLNELLLACGELEVVIFIADGPEAIERIVRDAAPLTRSNVSCAPVELVESLRPAVARLITELGQVFELTLPEMIIGSAEHANIRIVHGSISRHHAKVTRDPETHRYTIEDLQSTNGVRVDGHEVSLVELEDQSVVDLGHVRMLFDAGDDIIPNDAPLDIEEFLVIGPVRVAQRGAFIAVGDIMFALDEVREHALEAENLPLPNNHVLQAAMALLVVAAADRYEASRQTTI